MTQISLKYYTEPSNTVQKPSNYLKPPSIRGKNSKLALTIHNWLKKSLINMGNYTKFSPAGPKISPGWARVQVWRVYMAL